MARTVSVGAGVHDGRAYSGISIKIEGITPQDIKNSVERLGKVPLSALNMPVKKSATKVAQLARKNAPKRTGALRKGIRVRGRKEKGSARGKVIYNVWMDPAMNETFVKIAKTRGGTRYYYPGSMEYGFRTRNGRVLGRYYMAQAAKDLEPYHEQLVLDELGKKLDKAWAKKNGGSDP